MLYLFLIMPFLVSFTLTVLFTPPTIFLARRFGLVDDPAKRKHPAQIHKKIIPRAGGVPIFLALVISTLLILGWDKKIIGILLGATVLLIVGLFDDRFDLNPYLRFSLNILAALIPVAAGVGIAFITNPLGGVIRLDTLRISFDLGGPHSILILADLFALFWIVSVLNILNWSKGVDGQMPGIALIAFLTLAGLALRFVPEDPTQITIVELALIGAGAAGGFLIFNFHPAKIFPGYSATVLGYLIAVLAILAQAKIGAALLVMAVPAVDAAWTIIRRVYGGRSPFWGDRGHLHHKLLDLGLGQRQIALSYWAVCAILGALSLTLQPHQKFFTFALVGVGILGGLIWISQILRDRRKL